MRRATLLAALAVPTLQDPPPASLRSDGPDPSPPFLELPDCPAAVAWAAVAPDTAPVELPAELAALGTPGVWEGAGAWERWAGCLTLAADGAAGPEERAALCLLARAQGRAGDAWDHYRTLADTPRWAAAVTPLLVPGIPTDSPVEAGGRPAPLPDGVVLEPLLPPDSGTTPPWSIEWRTAKVRGLAVGEARVDLALTVEATGVQVDVTHVSGGRARFAVRLPTPQGHAIQVEYLDWTRRETLGEPIPVEVAPGEEPRALYGRLKPVRSRLPTGAVRALPAQMREGGLALVLPAGDLARERVAAIASSLAGLLDVRVSVRAEGEPDPSWTGTTFPLPAGPERAARLRFLASATERFLLGR